ncbi:MAG: copper transporter [Actinobacteria bacterium]|nr:copper transporter [Actinomycetota bacterium]
MFDLRYHVASLAAVFLALMIGILVGVGISDPGLADSTRLVKLQDEVDRLNERLEVASTRNQQQKAAEAFVEAAYGAVMQDRLVGKRIAIVFVGSVDAAVSSAVSEAVEDAGGTIVRLRALAVPLGTQALDAAAEARPGLADYMNERALADLGRDLGHELVAGGNTPLWDSLSSALVEERLGSGKRPADGVVVMRSAPPQRDPTGRFLLGFYSGLAGSVPVVGVEAMAQRPSSAGLYRRVAFSSVDAVDTPVGRVSLAVLLAGGQRGSYGVKDASDGAVPAIEPVAPAPPRR